jgi:hypothetical protein
LETERYGFWLPLRYLQTLLRYDLSYLRVSIAWFQIVPLNQLFDEIKPYLWSQFPLSPFNFNIKKNNKTKYRVTRTPLKPEWNSGASEG